ncbi:MAG: FAD-dependent thymidylate synthase [bacterium]|nr:FAD-dependent thymidylate synthase [bacterium]
MENSRYQPDFAPPEEWSEEDRYFLHPFATNLDGLVTALRNLPPEMGGALCSRASRASGYLLRVFLNEYIYEVLHGENREGAAELREIVDFYHRHGVRSALNNERARKFFAKNLAQYGDESIAQMTGTYLVFWGISQVAMKLCEDRRIGIQPIEKSTRFVKFSEKFRGKYLYYTDPDIEKAGLGEEYKDTQDFLFETNEVMVRSLQRNLKSRFPQEKESVLEKKAFDTCRGFLPMATIGQVAFFGNGQAFEYLINNCAQQKLGELRWIAEAARQELDQEIPSLLLRLDDEKTKGYQEYLGSRRLLMAQEVRSFEELGELEPFFAENTTVELVEYDPDGEAKVVAGILFPSSKSRWRDMVEFAKRMSYEEKRRIIAQYIEGRTERWQKVGRAFENAYVRFEITMNAGAYRDLHRHRMHTQERQLFTDFHGYDVPPELEEAGLQGFVHQAMEKASELCQKIWEKLGEEHAQYATTLFHRVRFYQYQNARQFFWEAELRTTPQGHPDYRKIEQEKFRLLREVYPLITDFMLVDMKEYDFARRGMEERIQRKEEKILERLQK